MANDPPTDPTWRPIATAPRDGTRILAYAIDDADDTQPQIIAWRKAKDSDHGEEGWHISWDGEFWGYADPFTHWMPLPEPPKP